jgi:hypothetical protein
MAFEGTEPIRSKIVTDNTISERVNTFTYLGCNISYQEEKKTYIPKSQNVYKYWGF